MNEELEDWFDSLGILAYGEISKEDLFPKFQLILQLKSDSVFISENVPEGASILEYWLLLSYLNVSDCIDYGTSPRGAWLTEKGEKILQLLKDHHATQS